MFHFGHPRHAPENSPTQGQLPLVYLGKVACLVYEMNGAQKSIHKDNSWFSLNSPHAGHVLTASLQLKKPPTENNEFHALFLPSWGSSTKISATNFSNKFQHQISTHRQNHRLECKCSTSQISMQRLQNARSQIVLVPVSDPVPSSMPMRGA